MAKIYPPIVLNPGDKIAFLYDINMMLGPGEKPIKYKAGTPFEVLRYENELVNDDRTEGSAANASLRAPDGREWHGVGVPKRYVKVLQRAENSVRRASGFPEPWRNSPYAHKTELFPISELKKYREYNWTRNHARRTPEEWEQLKQDIAQNGINDPLIFEYNPYNGYGYLGEGNHRLQIADELGMTYVPLRVYRNSYLEPEYPAAQLVEGGPVYPRGEYVPADLKPSQVFPKHLFQNSNSKNEMIRLSNNDKFIVSFKGGY